MRILFSNIKNNNVSKWAYYVVFILLVIWSLWSLVYSPTAWFDEVYFASVTHSFISGNGLAIELDHYEPCNTYGPVYFLITGAITKIFGFGMFQFRIVNCLFSFLSVFLLGKILEKISVNKGLNYLLQLLFLTDALFVSNSHSGRMEFVAITFVLLAYLYFLSGNKSDRIKTMVVSFMLTLAVMTTPRVVVICIPLAIFQLVNLFRSRSWSLLLAYIIIPILLYGIWVFVAFGSFEEMIAHYTQHGDGVEAQQSSLGRFVGGNWAISKYHYPLIFVALISMIIMFKNKSYKEIIIYITPIFIYYFLVNDTGLYGVLVLPYFIILLALGASVLLVSERKIFKVSFKALILICLVVNIAIFSLKAFTVISTHEQRDPRKPAEWIAKNIPEGSRVAGDYDYYYAAIENGCQFRRITSEEVKDEEFIADVISTFNPDYIVLRKSHLKISELPLIKNAGYELTSVLENNTRQISSNIQKVTKLNFTSSYEGCIYKRVNIKK